MSEAALAKEPNGQARQTIDGVDMLLVKDGSNVYAMQVSGQCHSTDVSCFGIGGDVGTPEAKHYGLDMGRMKESKARAFKKRMPFKTFER
jgi:hypothetical protein